MHNSFTKRFGQLVQSMGISAHVCFERFYCYLLCKIYFIGTLTQSSCENDMKRGINYIPLKYYAVKYSTYFQ